MSYRKFDGALLAHCDRISEAVVAGRYHLTPYREKLLPKGAADYPRCISVPTIRDRLLLSALKEFFHIIAPGAIPRCLPNEHIRLLKAFFQANSLGQLSVVRLDVKAFFPSVPHRQLLERLERLVECPSARQVTRRALRTPTLPLNTSRRVRFSQVSRQGIPQGLPISNFLANAFLLDFDALVSPKCLLFQRYVDDILIIVPTQSVAELLSMVGDALHAIGLELNKKKSISVSADERFEFLGYSIKWPVLSVRRANEQRFLSGIARLFVQYRTKLSSDRGFPNRMGPDLRRAAFLEELNERLTGAVSGRRRYGWISYFAELNDLALLSRLDRVVAGMFVRLEDFGRKPPVGLKRLVRAHYEARHSPEGGYIVNYNAMVRIQDKLDHLIRRGIVEAGRAPELTEGEVEELYAATRNRSLSDLDQDVSFVY